MTHPPYPPSLLAYARQHGYTHYRNPHEAVFMLYRPAPVNPHRWGERVLLLDDDQQIHTTTTTTLINELHPDALLLPNEPTPA